MSENSVFSPPENYGTFFGHFSTFSRHFVNIPLSGPSNDLPVTKVWRVSNATLGDAALVLSAKNWKIYSRWGAASKK